MSILVLAHVESDGALARPSLESVTAAAALAKQLNAPLTVGLVGADTAAAVTVVSGSSAGRVLTAPAARHSRKRATPPMRRQPKRSAARPAPRSS